MSETCPSCGSSTPNLIPIDVGKKLALNLQYDHACPSCYESLPEKVSQGYKLRKEEEQKRENKVKLWKSRTELVKQGRSFFQQKAYSESAMCYEKYLKVLKIVHDVEELTPEMFSNSARSKELTIITTVYFDLLRAYDTQPKYAERMAAVSKKLSQFAPYSPIFPNLVRNAEIFARNAKNPGPVKAFMKTANARKTGCFIATAAFGSAMEPEVMTFKNFRDETLNAHFLGRKFTNFYYFVSPAMARILNRYEFLKPLVRMPLRVLAKLIINLRKTK